METILSLKTEYDHHTDIIHLKYEDIPNKDPFLFLIKKEEDTDIEARVDRKLIHNMSLARTANQQLENLLRDLEEYLNNFVEVEDFALYSTNLSNKEAEEMTSEAKTMFKEEGIKVIKSLGEDLRKKAVQHVLPDSYLVQLNENTKQRIFNSYKQLKRNLKEILICDRDKEVPKDTNTKPKKIIRRKKCDFPRQARTLLRSWFIAHAQDPYPSHEEKIQLARQAGISMKQLENWLTNTRGRIWKKVQQSEPKFEAEIEELLLGTQKDFW